MSGNKLTKEWFIENGFSWTDDWTAGVYGDKNIEWEAMKRLDHDSILYIRESETLITTNSYFECKTCETVGDVTKLLEVLDDHVEL